MDFTLSEYIKYTGAKVIKNSTTTETFSVSTDTRKITGRDIYLPLVGEKFNGHDFIAQAVSFGAKGYFTSNEHIIVPDAEFILYVPDTLLAYLKIAEAYKNKIGAKTIAITGSSGKTTTKEMVASVCAKKYKTHKTLLNHNNEIGMAQTFLSAPEDTEIIVAEMGMRGLGEIDLLAGFAKPDIGLITNIGTAHIGRLGSAENIAKAKCELTKHIKKGGLLVMQDNPIAYDYIEFDGEVIKININKLIKSGDLKILDNSETGVEFVYKKHNYKLNIAGEHNIIDSLFAIEAGKRLEIPEDDIAQALGEYAPVGYRWKVQEIKDFSVINDCYNANYESMQCSIKTFLECYKKPHVLVLGDMGELGEKTEFYHKKIGELLNKYSPELLITIGNFSRIIAENTKWEAKSFETTKGAAEYITNNAPDGANILFKASRSMELEKITEEMEKV